MQMYDVANSQHLLHQCLLLQFLSTKSD